MRERKLKIEMISEEKRRDKQIDKRFKLDIVSEKREEEKMRR